MSRVRQVRVAKVAPAGAVSRPKSVRSSGESCVLPLICISALALLAYFNSLHVPFVFDDGASVEHNTGVRFGDYLSGSLLQVRSLLYITFTLNHKFGGMDPFGYHVGNLALHLINGILVFFIARHIFRRTGVPDDTLNWFAALAAALFVVHPVQTESVTYVSSRSELLSTFFYASAFLVFISCPEQKIGFLLGAAVSVLFAFGLVSKETVITLPAAFLVYDFVFLARGSFQPVLRRWRFYSVFLILGAAGSIFLLKEWTRVFGKDPLVLSPWHYLLTETRVIARYIRLLIFPVGLNLDYDFRASRSLLEPSVLISLALSIAIIAAALHWRRQRPLVAFAVLWFYVTLIPTSTFVPIQDVIFEHRLYLPMVGACLLFPFFVRKKAIACAAVALLLFGTVFRNDTWGDEVGLYRDIVSKSPGKARPYNALALAYARRGQVDEAIDAVKTGISMVPVADKFDLYTVLGNLYLQRGQFGEAITAYKNAVGGGDSAVAYNNLGIAYWKQWQQLRDHKSEISDSDFKIATQQLLSQAENAFQEGYARDHSNLTSLDTYIDVREDEGDLDAWRAQLLQQKESFDTLYSLGKIASKENNFAEAGPYFARAVRINSDDKLLHFNYAYALGQTEQTNAAIAEYLAAIRRDPTFWQAHLNVALLYMKNSDRQNAIAHFEEVLRLYPGFSQALVGLATLLEQNDPARARSYVQQALRENPKDPEALALWQRLSSGQPQ